MSTVNRKYFMAIDSSTLETEFRFLLGGITEDTISSDTVQVVISRGESKFSSDDEDYCNVLYYTVIESLRYLSRAQAVFYADNMISGAITAIEEEEGDVREKETYASSTDSTMTSWDDLLSYYLENPDYICTDLTGYKSETVVIGGAHVSPSENALRSRSRLDRSAYRVKNNRCEPYPWRPHHGRDRRGY